MTAIDNHINKTIASRLAIGKRDYGDAFSKPICEKYVPPTPPDWETEFSEQPDGLEMPEFEFEIV